MSSLEPKSPSGLPTPTVKYRMPSVHQEGIKFVVIAALITAILWWGLDWDVLGWLMAGITLWVAAFFRDPVRVTPLGAGLVVSPADGLVCQISEVEPPRQLAADMEPGRYTRVSIFMSVFDVHINRSPIAGVIRRIVYVPGKFVNADLDKASEDNERQYFLVEGADGVRIAFTQIAGLVARRIMKFGQEGDTVAAGERVGLIRFGSRVDVYLPAGTAPTVALGQRAIAGETILGKLGETSAAGGIAQ
jgi:phosphatidylserine decarboxylase